MSVQELSLDAIYDLARKVMLAKMLDKTFCIRIEVLWELYLIGKYHFEDVHWIVRHERWSSVSQLIDHNAESIPINLMGVSLVCYDFWSDVLWSSTKSICLFPTA